MVNSNDYWDYSAPEFFKEFSMPGLIRSVSAFSDNKLAVLGDLNNTIRICNYGNDICRTIPVNFFINSLAPCSTEDNQLVFATPKSIQIAGCNIAGLYDCESFSLSSALSCSEKFSLIDVIENQIFVKCDTNISILIRSGDTNTWSLFQPQNNIKNLDANYCVAALGNNLFAIGSGEKLYIFDAHTRQTINEFNTPVDMCIRAITRLGSKHFAIGFVRNESDYKGRYMNIVCIYDTKSLKEIKELSWNNGKLIKYLVAPLSGNQLVIGFEECRNMKHYTELLPDKHPAGDLHKYNASTFMIYQFPLSYGRDNLKLEQTFSTPYFNDFIVLPNSKIVYVTNSSASKQYYLSDYQHNNKKQLKIGGVARLLASSVTEANELVAVDLFYVCNYKLNGNASLSCESKIKCPNELLFSSAKIYAILPVYNEIIIASNIGRHILDLKKSSWCFVEVKMATIIKKLVNCLMIILNKDKFVIAEGKHISVLRFGNNKEEVVLKFEVPGEIKVLARVSDSKFAVLCGDNKVQIYNIYKIEPPLLDFDFYKGKVRVLAVSPSGDKLFVGFEKGYNSMMIDVYNIG